MPPDINRWRRAEGVDLLKSVGIKKGDLVLDFGCGTGCYTIPAAIIVGREGKVYALDKDGDAIGELMKTAKEEGLYNIKPMVTSGELDLDIEDDFFDVSLLYDVIHHYYFDKDERKHLLSEIYRVTKRGGILSIFPRHIDLKEIKREVENAGFYFKNTLSRRVVHYYSYEYGIILNFYK